MTNQTNKTFTLIENDLVDLSVILDRLGQFAEPFESDDSEKMQASLDESLPNLLKALAPHLSDEQAKEMSSLSVLTLATRKASNMASYILAAIQAAKEVPESDIKTETLIQWAKDNSTVENLSDKEREDFVKNIGWLLSSAVSYITSSGIYFQEPQSNIAIGIRLMASLLHRMEQMGFNFDEPHGEAA